MADHRKLRNLRRLGATLAIAGFIGVGGVPANASTSTLASDQEWVSIENLDLGPVDDDMRSASVARYGPDGTINRYSRDGTVSSVETVEQDGAETVINLSSDILFDTDKAELPATAGPRLASLLEAVPQNADLAVHGHTDTVGTDEYNLDLSRRRAEAVAAAVRSARPDLVLDVQGFGKSRLKVQEGGDDIAEDRAANRRVELRYKT